MTGDRAERTRAVWLDTLAYHVTRHFPAWAGWLPAHMPRLKPIAAPSRKPSPAPARVEAMHDEGVVEAGR